MSSGSAHLSLAIKVCLGWSADPDLQPSPIDTLAAVRGTKLLSTDVDRFWI